MVQKGFKWKWNLPSREKAIIWICNYLLLLTYSPTYALFCLYSVQCNILSIILQPHKLIPLKLLIEKFDVTELKNCTSSTHLGENTHERATLTKFNQRSRKEVSQIINWAVFLVAIQNNVISCASYYPKH